MVATILNHLYNGGGVRELEIAMLSKYAENEYFGKPSGLMDQTTCAVGGFVTIDFKDAARPRVDRVRFDFGTSGYSLVIVDTGGSHAELNEEYAAIEGEMKAVARAFGGIALREFSKERVLNELPLLRTKVSDRAILRALHFYDDDRRVVEQVAALEGGRFDEFLRLVIESGRSSWMWCQNCYLPRTVGEQGISVALAASEALLAGSGAWRVHGGGFAGTIQAFVPDAKLPQYLGSMRSIFGPASCHALMIRSVGSAMVDLS
jgi:galactokinase